MQRAMQVKHELRLCPIFAMAFWRRPEEQVSDTEADNRGSECSNSKVGSETLKKLWIENFTPKDRSKLVFPPWLCHFGVSRGPVRCPTMKPLAQRRKASHWHKGKEAKNKKTDKVAQPFIQTRFNELAATYFFDNPWF